jgi:putative sterol carrier protein
MTPDEAEARGLAHLEGDSAATERAIAILGPHFEATGGQHGIVGAVRARFQRQPAQGVHETYEFRIADQVFHAVVDDGGVEMNLGPAKSADAAITSDLATFLELGIGKLAIADALRAGRLEVLGETQSAMRMGSIFGARFAPRDEGDTESVEHRASERPEPEPALAGAERKKPGRRSARNRA